MSGSVERRRACGRDSSSSAIKNCGCFLRAPPEGFFSVCGGSDACGTIVVK